MKKYIALVTDNIPPHDDNCLCYEFDNIEEAMELMEYNVVTHGFHCTVYCDEGD